MKISLKLIVILAGLVTLASAWGRSRVRGRARNNRQRVRFSWQQQLSNNENVRGNVFFSKDKPFAFVKTGGNKAGIIQPSLNIYSVNNNGRLFAVTRPLSRKWGPKVCFKRTLKGVSLDQMRQKAQAEDNRVIPYDPSILTTLDGTGEILSDSERTKLLTTNPSIRLFCRREIVDMDVRSSYRGETQDLKVVSFHEVLTIKVRKSDTVST